MFTPPRVVVPALMLAACLLGSASLRAEYTVLTGMFDGSEPIVPSFWGERCAHGPSGYRQVEFTVSTTGSYAISDAFRDMYSVGGVSVAYKLYVGGYTPADPSLNFKHQLGDGSYRLYTGFTYVLLLQDRCVSREGAWSVVVSGPGPINSNNVVAVPGFTKGNFTANDPTLPTPGCTREVSAYEQSGPIRVSRSGIYYFSQGNAASGPYVFVRVYTSPVNSANLQANLVPYESSGWGVKLQTGQDYYFVAHQCSGTTYGEYLYVVAPPAPLRINAGLAGTWHNPDTPGQGFFLTVYEKLNQVFLAWFTYADDPAPDDEYGHRWMTAFGKFEGPSADLDIEWTAGGAFDSAQPAPEQHVDGNILLEFNDCSSGQITYGWGLDGSGADAVSGVIPIQRHTDEAVAQCESLYAGPGMPGPL